MVDGHQGWWRSLKSSFCCGEMAVFNLSAVRHRDRLVNEPMKINSGSKRQEGFYSYMEMRDEKVAIFMRNIDQGDHLIRYRLRAEIPGVFHALPTRFYAMYVPELKANSNEHVMKIID